MPTAELTLPTGSGNVAIRLADGGMEWVAAQLAAALPERPRLFIISDSRVALLYEMPLTEALAEHGFDVTGTVFDPGEEHKNLRTAAQLLDALADRQLARDDVVIGLGGGVATDMAGFVASVYQRGIRWVAVPTTVMGMVDAAIGGKTGVDHPLGKNLIGSFHQPTVVLAALDALATLAEREWTSGSAEVVKAAMLSGGLLWQEVLRQGPNLRSWPWENLRGAMYEAARVKVEIVARDEREGGVRRLLNLGHSFGHALEWATRYRHYRHGEAVFLGLRASVRLSEQHGLMTSEVAREIDALLQQAHVPRAGIHSDSLLAALGRDKKIRARALHWILLKEPGEPEIVSEVPKSLVRETASWLAAEAGRGGAIPAAAYCPHIMVLNGPNLNLLGEREPALYGSATYAELESQLFEFADELGVELLVRQSNVEGELVGLIQQARHWADGIVINPGGYAHTSVAIRDALGALTLPAIEVHLTDVSRREDFRRVSLTAAACRATIQGRGLQGYFDAMRDLKTLIDGATASPAAPASKL